jgi:hypothetical protein
MFLDTSRYHRVRQETVPHRRRGPVTVVALRRLPSTPGTPATVKQQDRLDVMAQRRYDNPTMFWRIADANTELEARDLVATTGRVITLPEHSR